MSTDHDDFKAEMAELTAPKHVYVHAEELALAGGFVSRYGTLGGLFDDPSDLASVQFVPGLFPAAAWVLIGHWSVDRGDGRSRTPRGFEEHLSNCGSCHFLERVLALREEFEAEPCRECGLDLAGHDVSVDDQEQPHVTCRAVWERREPLAAPAGHVGGDIQTSDAYNAQWTAPLTDGTFAVVTRSYYRAELNGRTFIERDNEYAVCVDPADPGGTEHGATGTTVEVDSDDPFGEDMVALAEQSFAPEPGEWQENAPEWARDLLVQGHRS